MQYNAIDDHYYYIPKANTILLTRNILYSISVPQDNPTIINEINKEVR